jgi:hypothetical protein
VLNTYFEMEIREMEAAELRRRLGRQSLLSADGDGDGGPSSGRVRRSLRERLALLRPRVRSFRTERARGGAQG